MKLWIWILLAIAAFAVPASAGNEYYLSYTLFGGSNVDSTEQASPWVSVRGANRLVLRTWTTHAGAADSLYSDSLASFKVLFSDSVKFIARDSSGTIVTANSGIPASLADLHPFPMCADSFAIDIPASTTRSDTLVKLVLVAQPPYLKPLKGSVTGSGIYTYVVPTAPASISTYGDGSILPQYMRIRCTPGRRPVNGDDPRDNPTRVNGLKGFRMELLVYYKNR